ncbi:MAG: ATP-binding protein, partial [Okeania sp. SIO2H7]|nr:ATP-binding protein [Okeania sp. SIO2H7]
CQQVFEIIHQAFFAHTHFLPPERTTAVSLPPLGGGEINPIQRTELMRNSIPLIEPVKQLLRDLSTAYQDNLSWRKEQIEENPQIGEYLKLADFLESEILLGKLKFETSIEKELLFIPTEGDIKLGMPVVSAMVKELAPLVLYLRYLAEPNDLLIIDEPETNLHPAVQVEIVEFLGMLINAGLNLLITTHSPYIVDQLVNLMKAQKHEEKERIKELFYLEKSDYFIPQERVSVYLFEEGNTKNILRKNGIIDWDTFSDVSEDVSELYSRLLTVEDLD